MLSEMQVNEVRSFAGEAMERLSWSRDQVHAEQTRRLRRLVAHAQQKSAFHSDRIGHLDAASLEVGDLKSIPPMTKNDVMSNWDRIVTDPRVRLSGVTEHLEQLLNGEKQNHFFLDEYYASATGGSSGHRGVFLWDRETIVVTANVANRMDARRDLQNPPPFPRRTAVICAGSLVHASRLLFPITIDPQRETRVFPADLAIDDMVVQLNDFQPDRIIGYASIVQELCERALDGQLSIAPTLIRTNSEPLTPEARKMAIQAWGIDIHNTWGSVETGVAATEGDSLNGMSLAEDFLIFEPVDREYQPVANSDQADRLLVTKLFGPIMPLIRYELTDTIVVDDGENPDAPGYRRIVEIKGRADSWFVYPSGVRIHPMVFRGVLGQVPGISEYQVQQTEDGAMVLAVTRGDLSSASVGSQLSSELQRAGLSDARIVVREVDRIPRHPQTNKVKRFVPLHPG